MPNSPSGSLPPATEYGVLPEGIHEASLQEISERFGRIQRSTRRYSLVENLLAYLTELEKAGWDATIILNGSFVMECVDEPSDIDLVLVLPASWDMSAELNPFEYNLLSRKQTRKAFRIHVVPVRTGSKQEIETLAYFHGINIKWHQGLGIPLGTKKGLVRVSR